MGFSKKNKNTFDHQTISTIIGEGCIIGGGLTGPAFARIDGQITGDVTITEGIILGEKGSIQGNVTTKELFVYGAINGNIVATALEIKSTGKINGDIKTNSLAIETGAVYNGALIMGS